MRISSFAVFVVSTFGCILAACGLASVDPESSGAGGICGPDGCASLLSANGHTCAVTPSGGVKCWGPNPHGQLGDGTTTHKQVPVPIVGLDSGVIGVTAGAHHTCALMSERGVKCWDSNVFGQLGDGTGASSLSPVPVVGLDSGVVSVSAGDFHTCAITSDGEAKCWGYDFHGEIGDGTLVDAPVPVQVVGLESAVVAISPGGTFTYAVTTDGAVMFWGGDDMPSPDGRPYNYHLEPLLIAGLDSGATAVSSGGLHACAIVSGGVKCWGSGIFGQLGYGVKWGSDSPVSVIGLESGVVGIAAGLFHTCAVTSSGAAKCWGASGHSGDGTSEDQFVPTQVLGLDTGVIAVAGADNHTCVLTEDGRVWCWGGNSGGQLGNNTTEFSNVPVQVVGFP